MLKNWQIFPLSSDARGVCYLLILRIHNVFSSRVSIDRSVTFFGNFKSTYWIKKQKLGTYWIHPISVPKGQVHTYYKTKSMRAGTRVKYVLMCATVYLQLFFFSVLYVGALATFYELNIKYRLFRVFGAHIYSACGPGPGCYEHL